MILAVLIVFQQLNFFNFTMPNPKGTLIKTSSWSVDYPLSWK